MSNIEKSCLQSLKKTKQIVCKRDKVKKIFYEEVRKDIKKHSYQTETKEK